MIDLHWFELEQDTLSSMLCTDKSILGKSPDMTDKLLTGMQNINLNKRCHKHGGLKQNKISVKCHVLIPYKVKTLHKYSPGAKGPTNLGLGM